MTKHLLCELSYRLQMVKHNVAEVLLSTTQYFLPSMSKLSIISKLYFCCDVNDFSIFCLMYTCARFDSLQAFLQDSSKTYRLQTTKIVVCGNAFPNTTSCRLKEVIDNNLPRLQLWRPNGVVEDSLNRGHNTHSDGN